MSGNFCPECRFAYNYRHREGCQRAGEKPPSNDDAIRAQIAELQARLNVSSVEESNG